MSRPPDQTSNRECDQHRAPSTLGHNHITLTGRYRIAAPDPLHDRSAYRLPKSSAAAAAVA